MAERLGRHFLEACRRLERRCECIQGCVVSVGPNTKRDISKMLREGIPRHRIQTLLNHEHLIHIMDSLDLKWDGVASESSRVVLKVFCALLRSHLEEQFPEKAFELHVECEPDDVIVTYWETGMATPKAPQ